MVVRWRTPFLWNMTPHHWVMDVRRFEETHCLHLHEEKDEQYEDEGVLEHLNTSKWKHCVPPKSRESVNRWCSEDEEEEKRRRRRRGWMHKPTGTKNQERPLKRRLGSWECNGSTSDTSLGMTVMITGKSNAGFFLVSFPQKARENYSASSHRVPN